MNERRFEIIQRETVIVDTTIDGSGLYLAKKSSPTTRSYVIFKNRHDLVIGARLHEKWLTQSIPSYTDLPPKFTQLLYMRAFPQWV